MIITPHELAILSVYATTELDSTVYNLEIAGLFFEGTRFHAEILNLTKKLKLCSDSEFYVLLKKLSNVL